MFNIKISKRKYIFISSLLIIVTVIASILFFNRESQKNFLAIIEVKFIKSIDHIFLPPESSGTLQQYAVQYLNNLLPEYEWSLQGEIIIAKIYTKGKKDFYNDIYPKLKARTKEAIPNVNEGIKNVFKDYYLDYLLIEGKSTEKSNAVDGSETSDRILFRLASKNYFSDFIYTKVRFRKVQMTNMEFIAITLFLSLTALGLITAVYLRKIK